MEFNYKNKYSLKVITHRNPRLFPLEKKSNISQYESTQK